MLFRKHLPRQPEINKFLGSFKKESNISLCCIKLSVKEVSAEYEKIPFFKDINDYITKGHVSLQIKWDALGRLKNECEDKS